MSLIQDPDLRRVTILHYLYYFVVALQCLFFGYVHNYDSFLERLQDFKKLFLLDLNLLLKISDFPCF